MHVRGFAANENVLPVSSRNIRPKVTEIPKNLEKILELSNDGDLKENVLGVILSSSDLAQLAKIDPKRAIDYANSLTTVSEREEALNMIVSIWAKDNPTDCYNWVMSMEDSKRKRSLLINAMTSIAETNNPQLLYSLINMTPKGELKDFSIFYVFGSLAKYDMTAALKLAKELSSENVASGVAEKLAIISIQSGIGNIGNILDDLPYGSFRDSFVTAAIDKASQRDPTSTFYWVIENQKICNFKESMLRVSSSFAGRDPEGGLILAEKIEDAKLRDAYVQNLGASWAYQEPADAGKWLFDRIQETDFNSNKEIGSGIIYQWVQWDHEKALTAIGAISDLQSRDQAMVVALQSFSDFDPASAAVRLLPLLANNSPENQKIMSELSSNWLRRDPLAASNWIGNIEQGPLKDASIEALVSNILSKDQDYKMANTWAAQVESVKQRNALFTKIQKQQDRSKK